MHSYLLRS